ncbi:MAG TPA: glycosyltransferase family 39 protein [Thermoanaerobaculia bacterium]|nr:glycosyltransferase family 39 protein [Thermoanaerobaculia bacterium]
MRANPVAAENGREAGWAVAGLLAIAALLRLASFGVTEVEWWDSTIYLTEARRIASGISWAPGYESHRAPLLPWIGALSYGAGLDETGVYLANILFSLGTVWLMFRVGALLFDRQAGLVAAFLMAVSWESLFFTQRILTETPALFFWLLSILVYVRSVVRGETAWLPLLGPAVALAFLTHFRAGAIALALALHFVAAKRWALLKRKEVVVSALLGFFCLASYAVFSVRRWGAPFEFLRGYQVRRLGSIGTEQLGVLWRYLEYLPTYLGRFLFAFLLVSVTITLAGELESVVRRSDSATRPERLRRGLLLAGLVFVPLAVPGLFEKFNHRLGIFCLPGLFLLLGASVSRLALRSRARSVAVSRAVMAGVLAIAASQQLSTADVWLHAEGKSYLSVKVAGLWVRDHSREGAVIVTTSWPQVNFYAERRTVGLPGSPAEFEALVRDHRAPFLVLSACERKPAWMESYLEANVGRLPRVYRSGDIRGLETSVYDCSRIAE